MKFRLQSFVESNRLSRNNMLERTTLCAREDGTIDKGRNILKRMFWAAKRIANFAHAKNQTTTRATQSLVRSRRHHMETMLKWIWMYATSNEASHVRHICHQKTARNFLANLCNAVEIRHFHKCGITNQDNLWLMFLCEALKFIIIEITSLWISAVSNKVVNLCALGYWRAVRKMATMTKIHA